MLDWNLHPPAQRQHECSHPASPCCENGVSMSTLIPTADGFSCLWPKPQGRLTEDWSQLPCNQPTLAAMQHCRCPRQTQWSRLTTDPDNNALLRQLTDSGGDVTVRASAIGRDSMEKAVVKTGHETMLTENSAVAQGTATQQKSFISVLFGCK